MPTPALHECCDNARSLLRGYTARGSETDYRWHLLGCDRYVLYCPWCGVCLEEWRKLQRCPDELPREHLEELQVKLRATGMVDRECSRCTRPFLTRDKTSTLCCPCRGLAKVVSADPREAVTDFAAAEASRDFEFRSRWREQAPPTGKAFCPDCHGRGFVAGAVCAFCEGDCLVSALELD